MKALIAVFVMSLSSFAASGLPSGWTDDFAAAKTRAAAEGKKILVFSGYGGGGSSAFMRRLEDSVKDAERERKRRK